MNATDAIHQAISTVDLLRAAQLAQPKLNETALAIKRFQAARFAHAYSDIATSKRFSAAIQFFLTELYSPRDFSQRDAQFSRIANTIDRLFPEAVVQTSVRLAQVHALTETLDHKMALALGAESEIKGGGYVKAWRDVGCPADRQSQLQTVLSLGEALDKLTKRRGLRSLLTLMRRPANAAGLASLQSFLESGFDAFSQMQGASEFLQCIKNRESVFIELMFNGGRVECNFALDSG